VFQLTGVRIRQTPMLADRVKQALLGVQGRLA
jgi:hypothetical protein